MKKKASSEFITFSKPDISDEEIRAVAHVMRSGWLSTGKVVQEFQTEFEKFIGGGYAVAVSSCSEALVASLTVACIGSGHEVIIPAMTFPAVINAVLQVGAKPVLVDVTASGHIDPNLVQYAITEKTRAIIAVHHAGAPCDMDEINRLAKRQNLIVIEDAAHAFGGSYKGQKIGTISHFTCFSFYPTKNITCGEGGMVICRYPDHATRIKTLILQGLTMGAWKRYGRDTVCNYQVEFPGHKGNMSDIHAAIGLAQLRRWPELREKRAKVWKVYEKSFDDKKGDGHSQHIFEIRSPRRDKLRQALYERKIGTGIHFKPLHLEPAYKFLRYGEGDFPKAERIGATTISLPVSSTMTVADAERVVLEVMNFELK